MFLCLFCLKEKCVFQRENSLISATLQMINYAIEYKPNYGWLTVNMRCVKLDLPGIDFHVKRADEESVRSSKGRSYIVYKRRGAFMSNVAFLWIFSRGMELGVIVLCLLPLRAILRKKVPRLFSYLLWAALPVNLVYNLGEYIWSKLSRSIVDQVNITPQIIVGESTVQIMRWFWVFGSVIVVIGMLVSYIVLLRRLVGSIRLRKGVYLTDRIGVPFTLGLLRPKIYLPYSLKEEYYESVILHECVHINRRDVWMKYLAVGILGLFWFQPILWFAYRLFVNDMEEACDETVLRQKGTGFREEYARSLLEVSDTSERVRGAAIGYGTGVIKSRIRHIMNYEKAETKKCVVAILVCCLFMILAVPISWQVPRVVRPSKEENKTTGMSATGTGITKMEIVTEGYEE